MHVERYDMCMWSGTTCTCGAVRHVHLKHRPPVREGAFPGK